VLTTVLFSQRDRRWKLADFGTASQATSKRLNTTRFSRGTSSYRAPEILREDAHYNNKADIFALGCIICEVALRRRMFSGDMGVWEYSAKRAPLVARIWPACVLGSSMHWLGRLADELLEIDPAKRPSATEVAKRLGMIRAKDRSTQDSVEGESFVPQIPTSHARPDIGDNSEPDPFEPVFTRVYNEGDPGSGIGGYDLLSPDDRVFAFDYLHSGSPDHLVLYRPGSCIIHILQNTNGNFERVYPQGDQGNGIGGYDLADPRDRVFPFDYEHSGKLDYLVAYRPGTRTIWILQNKDGEFSPVFRCPEDGISGWYLRDAVDRIFAFDYDNSGCQDHLVLHRRGLSALFLKNQNGQFSEAPKPNNGFLASAIDFDQCGTIWDILAQDGLEDSGFVPSRPMQFDYLPAGWRFEDVLPQFPDPDHWWQLSHSLNGQPVIKRLFLYDYDGTGKADHLVLYQPGTGNILILRYRSGIFSTACEQSGIGLYDLRSSQDRIFPFAYFPKGKASELCLYRPGTGTFWILRRF